MLASTLMTAVLLASSATTTPVTAGWQVHGIEKGKPVADLTTDVIVASAYSDQGPGLVFLCSKDKGLFSVLAYEPEEDLFEQASKTQNFLRSKTGTLTIGENVSEDVWLWKRRHETLQAKERKTGIQLLNAIFSGKEAQLSFNDMEQMTLTFPAAGEELKGFISNCEWTRSRPAD